MNATIADGSRFAHRQTRSTASFPFVSLPGGPGRVPIEVNLVARLGRGAGDKLFFEAAARQRSHSRFVDELDEPSARLGGTDFKAGDATALYTFGVGHRGHPFHRHAGHRVFTAVSGSGGAQLRFCSATLADIERDPGNFVRGLHHVNVPADCLFTVRFCGAVWHQFAPLMEGARHPAFFALSTHTNELGGDLSEALRQRVLADEADIPSLTELLPQAVARRIAASPPRSPAVPTTELSLHDRPGGLLEAACRRYRSLAGNVQRWRFRLGTRPGFVSVFRHPKVTASPVLAPDCLLRGELRDRAIHHQDSFLVTARPAQPHRNAADWLAALLAGFLDNRPVQVSRMMALRNVLVRPLGLRTSPLGCPVSSLLAPASCLLFRGRFPVRSQAVSDDGRTAQVILGADDKHLVFRTCVAVRMLDDGAVQFSLSDRVACTNLFGRFYMAAIAAAHRRFVVPAMLSHAVDAALEPQER